MQIENRHLERFAIAIPAVVSLNDKTSSQGLRMDLLSRDISSDGAFFLTTQPLDVGTPVLVEMLIIPQPEIIQGKNAHVTITGEVLRKEIDGMAIRFDRQYQISSVSASLSKTRNNG